MPIYAFCFMIFTMANVGLPGTSGFVGEFLTLLAAFKANTWVAFFATTGVILSAAYALYLYRRMIYGALEKPKLKAIADMTPREIVVMAPLVILTILFGFYPAPILDVTAKSVNRLVERHDAAVKKARAESATRVVISPTAAPTR
jgi:NADH-quinone oxidoreductase subunit M